MANVSNEGNLFVVGAGRAISLARGRDFTSPGLCCSTFTLTCLHLDGVFSTSVFSSSLTNLLLTFASKLNTLWMNTGHSRPHLQVPSALRYSVTCSTDLRRTLVGLQKRNKAKWYTCFFIDARSASRKTNFARVLECMAQAVGAMHSRLRAILVILNMNWPRPGSNRFVLLSFTNNNLWKTLLMCAVASGLTGPANSQPGCTLLRCWTVKK